MACLAPEIGSLDSEKLAFGLVIRPAAVIVATMSFVTLTSTVVSARAAFQNLWSEPALLSNC